MHFGLVNDGDVRPVLVLLVIVVLCSGHTQGGPPVPLHFAPIWLTAVHSVVVHFRRRLPVPMVFPQGVQVLLSRAGAEFSEVALGDCIGGSIACFWQNHGSFPDPLHFALT